MHTILLKTIQDLGGTATTGDVVRRLKDLRDKKIYSALEGYATNGFLTKEKIPPKLTKNMWKLTDKGSNRIQEHIAEGGTFDLKKYTKEVVGYRKLVNQHKERTGQTGRIQPKDIKGSKAVQKDLLTPAPKPKKEPEVDMGPMSEAANAAVDGIARVVEENQQLHRERRQFKQMYLQLHEIFGN